LSGGILRGMSRANLEVIRRCLSCFGAAHPDSGIEMLCPDAEWDVSDFLDGEVYKGRAAIRAFWEYLYEEVWESVKMVEEGLIDAGDTVVAMVRFQGAGRSSGAPVDLPIAWTFEFRRGCIARVKFSLDRTAALEAVGRRD
jgi:ketosteroid isomerase-like protein